jgi:hypothetical protein
MKKFRVNDDNKSYIVRRYVDNIISGMDNEDIYLSFKDYLFKEKMEYPNDTLDIEIKRHFPDILEDHRSELVVGKEHEYAKTI